MKEVTITLDQMKFETTIEFIEPSPATEAIRKQLDNAFAEIAEALFMDLAGGYAVSETTTTWPPKPKRIAPADFWKVKEVRS
ncbi:hypothetical protein [Allomesorhizobium alhagi]|uniref:Uncharacterized protein n=1 Tax=Mesorhizobium alhagi CCNWXJ12-2 TaxID=1107882 RepID=H0HNM0_9HYPH|nr:hypothetical protein [Mesorhizobium alhagi]EHK57673.1 hypothetical protein MAXJ12_08714 [Mesorhizobium alhagi CCNWXJ12-2]